MQYLNHHSRVSILTRQPESRGHLRHTSRDAACTQLKNGDQATQRHTRGPELPRDLTPPPG